MKNFSEIFPLYKSYFPISNKQNKSNVPNYINTKNIISLLIFIIITICFIKYNRYIFSILLRESKAVSGINEDFIKDLKKILKNEEIIENEMMDKHTTFKIGGKARIFTKPNNINQIIEIIKLCNENKVNYFVLGNGSNLLVSDDGFEEVIIQIHDNFSKLDVIKESENVYTLIVGAGMLMKKLAIEACLLSLTRLEDIIDIPGTVGGGIFMNAAFKRIGLKPTLKKIKVITSEGNILELSKEECKLDYRESIVKEKKYIVFEAIFQLQKGDQLIIQQTLTNNTALRYEKQPMYFGSAGSYLG